MLTQNAAINARPSRRRAGEWLAAFAVEFMLRNALGGFDLRFYWDGFCWDDWFWDNWFWDGCFGEVQELQVYLAAWVTQR